MATGELSDSQTGFPGYNGYMPQSAATVARILQLNGYATAMFGKHHNLPADQQSAAGPFTQWPTGLALFEDAHFQNALDFAAAGMLAPSGQAPG